MPYPITSNLYHYGLYNKQKIVLKVIPTVNEIEKNKIQLFLTHNIYIDIIQFSGIFLVLCALNHTHEHMSSCKKCHLSIVNLM